MTTDEFVAPEKPVVTNPIKWIAINKKNPEIKTPFAKDKFIEKCTERIMEMVDDTINDIKVDPFSTACAVIMTDKKRLIIWAYIV